MDSRPFSLDFAVFDHRSFDLSDLELPFSEEEIWCAVKLLTAGKSTGYDGFTSEFLCSAWEIVKCDICEALGKLYSMNGHSFQRLNEALITLIPKKQDDVSLTDYRPISLIHLLAKLFAKVLSLWLSPRLGELVSANQSAFISGRSAHEIFLLVQQTTRLLHNLKVPHMLLKLDITRAFDSLSCQFLFEVLDRYGFGPRFREWLAILLSTSSTRII